MVKGSSTLTRRAANKLFVSYQRIKFNVNLYLWRIILSLAYAELGNLETAKFVSDSLRSPYYYLQLSAPRTNPTRSLRP